MIKLMNFLKSKKLELEFSHKMLSGLGAASTEINLFLNIFSSGLQQPQQPKKQARHESQKVEESLSSVKSLI